MVKDGNVFIPEGAKIRVEVTIPDAPWDGKCLQWAEITRKDYTPEDFGEFLHWAGHQSCLAMMRGMKQNYPGLEDLETS